MTRITRKFLIMVAVLLAVWPVRPAVGQAQAPGTMDKGTHRVVHRFDFDEREEGNLEDIPKYWEPFRPPGFPKFTAGRFDFGTGRDGRMLHAGCDLIKDKEREQVNTDKGKGRKTEGWMDGWT